MIITLNKEEIEELIRKEIDIPRDHEIEYVSVFMDMDDDTAPIKAEIGVKKEIIF